MNIEKIKYNALVKTLAKPGEQILESLTATDCHNWHMASCITGEAGELFDAVKKQVIYRKEIDRKNVVEEMGDIEFYLEGLRQGLGITREEVIEANFDKLSKTLRFFEVQRSGSTSTGGQTWKLITET